jgi:hypothetical protein
VGTPAAASTTTYCKHLLAIGPTRIQLDMQLTQGQLSPDPAAANTLLTFLAQRFVASYGPNGLNCVGLLNTPDPVAVTTDGNGVAISATFNAGNTDTQNQNTNPAAGAVTTPTSGATTTPAAPTTSPTVVPTTGASTTPATPTTSPTVVPTSGASTTPATPTTSPTVVPTTGATPTPTAPAAIPTVTPTTGMGN